MVQAVSASLETIYLTLRQHFGRMPEWWPIYGDDAPFEMLLGAVLVQQTRWEAVESAILRLRDAQLLSPLSLAQADSEELALLLRPVAYYRQKAGAVIAICAYLCRHYQGSTTTFLSQPTALLHRELLSLPRIGPETADVILLYAGQHAVFVVDEYTRRLFERIAPAMHSQSATGFDWIRARYKTVQMHIEQELTAGNSLSSSADVLELYATYHALINEQCVRYCLARRPRCDGPPARRVYSIQEGRESYLDRHDGCPLREVCAFYQGQKMRGGEEAQR